MFRETYLRSRAVHTIIIYTASQFDNYDFLSV